MKSINLFRVAVVRDAGYINCSSPFLFGLILGIYPLLLVIIGTLRTWEKPSAFRRCGQFR